MCSSFVMGERPLPEVPDAPKSEINSLGVLRVSLLSVLRNETHISTSLTFLRPYELGAGIFNDNRLSGYYFNGGFFIPWIGDRYTFGKGTTREVFLTVGYREEFPNKIFDIKYTFDKLRYISYEIGLENVEWMTPYFGFDLKLSLGFKQLIDIPDTWDGNRIEPLLDISLGFAI